MTRRFGPSAPKSKPRASALWIVEPVRGVAPGQPGHQIPVQFHHLQMFQLLQQRPGQRALPRPDLDHRVAGRQAEGIDDAPHDTAASTRKFWPNRLRGT